MFWAEFGSADPLKEGEDVRRTFFPIWENPKTNVFYEAYALLSYKIEKKLGVIVLIYALQPCIN